MNAVKNINIFGFSNNPNMLNPITAEFETTLSSPNAALLSAACSAPDVSAITIGVMASPIDQRIQIQCSMSEFGGKINIRVRFSLCKDSFGKFGYAQEEKQL